MFSKFILFCFVILNTTNAFNSSITFENIYKKYNYTNNFLGNVINLVSEGYEPFYSIKDKTCPINMNFTENISYDNIYMCQMEYTYKIVKEMNIEYIPFEILKLIIRDINYDNYINFTYKNYRKRKRKKLIRHINKNYLLFTESEEIKAMSNICSIQYDKLDLNKIKKKYNNFIDKNNNFILNTKIFTDIAYILKVLLGIMIFMIFKG